MPTFRESCSSLHQGKEQPDTVSGYFSSWWSELQSSRNVGIPRMDLDMEETRGTHNFYIKKWVIVSHIFSISEYNFFQNSLPPFYLSSDESRRGGGGGSYRAVLSSLKSFSLKIFCNKMLHIFLIFLKYLITILIFQKYI